jgi:hypothetical protein
LDFTSLESLRGLGKHPTIIDKKGQKKLMKLAIDTHLSNLRLDRCKRMLWNASDQFELEKDGEITWDKVLIAFEAKYPD